MVVDSTGKVAPQLLDLVELRALTDDHQPRLGKAGCQHAPRARQSLDILVALERADEDHRRLLRQRRHRSFGEGGEVAVRRERDRRRLAADLLDELPCEGRDRARRVGAPHGPLCEPVDHHGHEPPRARAVGARERPPVTVHLDDHGRATAREPPAREGGGADDRVGGDDRVRRESPDLIADAQRQPQVEGERVERRRPARAAQAGSARPTGRCRRSPPRAGGSRAAPRRRPTSSPASRRAAARSASCRRTAPCRRVIAPPSASSDSSRP